MRQIRLEMVYLNLCISKSFWAKELKFWDNDLEINANQILK